MMMLTRVLPLCLALSLLGGLVACDEEDPAPATPMMDMGGAANNDNGDTPDAALDATPDQNQEDTTPPQDMVDDGTPPDMALEEDTTPQDTGPDGIEEDVIEDTVEDVLVDMEDTGPDMEPDLPQEDMTPDLTPDVEVDATPDVPVEDPYEGRPTGQCIQSTDCPDTALGAGSCSRAFPGGACIGCGVDDHCPSGAICNFGNCVTECEQNDDCPPGLQCNARGLCLAQSCSDDQCPTPLFACSDSGQCERPTCATQDQCPTDTTCTNGRCIEDRAL